MSSSITKKSIFVFVLQPADVTHGRSKHWTCDTVRACKIHSVFLFFLIIHDEPLLTKPRHQQHTQTTLDKSQWRADGPRCLPHRRVWRPGSPRPAAGRMSRSCGGCGSGCAGGCRSASPRWSTRSGCWCGRGRCTASSPRSRSTRCFGETRSVSANEAVHLEGTVLILTSS